MWAGYNGDRTGYDEDRARDMCAYFNINEEFKYVEGHWILDGWTGRHGCAELTHTNNFRTKTGYTSVDDSSANTFVNLTKTRVKVRHIYPEMLFDVRMKRTCVKATTLKLVSTTIVMPPIPPPRVRCPGPVAHGGDAGYILTPTYK